MIVELLVLVSNILLFIGVWLNARLNRKCFWLWIAGNLISAAIHGYNWQVMFVVRDIGFVALAVYGLRKWSPPVLPPEGKS
jgi:hypothetical protein